MSALKTNRNIQRVLLGDSLMQGLSRYTKVWNSFFRKDALNCGIRGEKVKNLLWRVENLEFPPAIRQIVILCGTNNIDANTPNDIANGLLCSALTIKKRSSVTNVYITGLLPGDFRETRMRNKIKEVNELIRKKCLSISTPRINYIKQDLDWIDKGNCLRTKYYYRDCLHPVELGNKKLSNTITKAIKHSNLTIPMNTKKYKATAALTGEDFPPLSRHSTKTFNPKLLLTTPPHKNILFSEIARQTPDKRCNNIISVTKTLPQIHTTGYMKSKLKTENVTCIKACPTAVRQRDTTKKKKPPIKKSEIISNIIFNNIYSNLHHFGNNITVQVDDGNTNTKQVQRTRNARGSKNIQIKSEEISSPSKLFYGAPFSYFSGTCVSRRFYSNLISKSRSHLIFTVALFFYVLVLCLIFRNYFLSPKLNHGFPGENTTFLKINYKYTHHTKYLHLEEYILSTCNFNRIDRVKHKIALEHNFQSNNFSQPNHDNEFTFCLIKVALSLVFGLKQFTKTRTKLFAFFLLSQFSI